MFLDPLLETRDRLFPVLLGKSFDTTLGVDELLAAGEKWMAVGADLEPELLLGGPGLPGCATSAARVDLVILRVDTFLHYLLLVEWRKLRIIADTALERRSSGHQCAECVPCVAVNFSAWEHHYVLTSEYDCSQQRSMAPQTVASDACEVQDFGPERR